MTDPGELHVVDVGPIAHGGHCVARLDGRVVFVRHCLPGERVRIRITDTAARFWRGDTVEVLVPSAARVEPPCALAGECGGCDFQHVAAEAQLDLLTSVVAEQLRRLAGIEWNGRVEGVAPTLGWRTRMSWSVDEGGHCGLKRHRSHEVLPVETCPIADPRLPDVSVQSWDADAVESIVSATGETMLVTDATIGDELEDQVDTVVATDGTVRAGGGMLTERVSGEPFQVSGSGFWQVHPAAAQTLVGAVSEAAQVQPGDTVVDLYAGVGLFSRFLSAQGADRIVAVEYDRKACADARTNVPEAIVVAGDVVATLRSGRVGERADVVVLDPPRTGAKKAVGLVADLHPRRIVYVACDPAALARDIAGFAARGYNLDTLRGFALFPMTHHVECVASLVPDGV